MSESPIRPVVLVGPTAVGKSELALELAVRFEADIVTADSRQVYRYMDIGTAKPTPSERAATPHFMLDLVEPGETYSSQRFAEEARRVLHRSAAASRLPLIAGGTGYYVRTLLDAPQIPPVPPDPQLRRDLRADAAQRGPEALHADLARLDPASASRIHPNNVPRVIRALEIVRALNGPVPEAGVGDEIPALYLGLTLDRDRLRGRAYERARRQVKAGLVEETRLLLEMGYTPDAPGLQGFGYRQMVTHLEGRIDLETAVEEYCAATHQYIRRQMTWFRQDSRISWIDAGPGAAREAARLIDRWLATVAT